jgi:hypothetical protein
MLRMLAQGKATQHNDLNASNHQEFIYKHSRLSEVG